MVKLNVLAADIHKRMVEDDRFGYSWAERYGATAEEWTVDGIKVQIKVGDYDCSSSTITAWRLALAAAGVDLQGATYTGNMRAAFLSTGLFEWVPVEQAQRGDLYLNEANHVAMCQGNGALSEFSSNEFGGAYGGVRGDQTGREARMGGYYSYPWDGCLHYIGDKEAGTVEGGWKHDDKGWWYVEADGGYPKETWKLIAGKWYLFDRKGYACEGWQKDGGSWYYLEPAPHCWMRTGWLLDGGAWYFLDWESGKMAASTCLKLDGRWYAFGGDGKLLTPPKTDSKGALVLEGSAS